MRLAPVSPRAENPRRFRNQTASSQIGEAPASAWRRHSVGVDPGRRAEGAVERAERAVAQVEGDGGHGGARLGRIGQPALGGLDAVAVHEVGEVAMAELAG